MLMVILALILGPLSLADRPFWQTKERVYERVQNRDIIVSVKEVPGTERKNLRLSGGGQIHTPCAFAFTLSEDFAQVAKESGYLEDVRYDESTRVLNARISAYGYKADTEIELAAKRPDEGHSFFTMLVRKGPLSGLKGKFTFYPVGPKKCDVGLDGDYGYEKFPLPQFFLRFGMEVMFQRMAARLRGYAEGRYVQNQSP